MAQKKPVVVAKKHNTTKPLPSSPAKNSAKNKSAIGAKNNTTPKPLPVENSVQKNADTKDEEVKPLIIEPAEISATYKRSSLYTIMTSDTSRNFESDIQEYFMGNFLPDKYNRHNLEMRTVPSNGASDQSIYLLDYLNKNKVGNKLVAKWFNRSKKGGFNMQLIKDRGYYDADILDVKIAKNSTKGIAALADAGEELVANTFILINDSKYTNKEEVAGKARVLLNLAATYANKTSSIGNQLADIGLQTFGKGFVVATRSYLFRLVWNEEVQNIFYTKMYADDSHITPAMKQEFDNSDLFKLEFVGVDKSYADIQSTAFTTKSNSELIGRSTIKSVDKVIAKLQTEYDVFQVKTPIYSTNPITAQIGLKEGLSAKTKFEVLERQQDPKTQKLKWVRVGTLKVDTKYPIWDNRFAADEENPNQKTDKTYFKIASGKDFAEGMLIKQYK